MSGLLERIARRRRAPASGWFGQQLENGTTPVNGSAPNQPTAVNGAASAPPVVHAQQPATEARETAGQAAQSTRTETTQKDDQATTELSSVELPAPGEKLSRAGFRQRRRIRRRARYLRHLREVQLRDIGGFMVELHRFGRQRPNLVEAKVQAASHVDLELKALERALGNQRTPRELREAGIGGACENCGAVHGSEDNFCAACGTPLGSGSKASDDR